MDTSPAPEVDAVVVGAGFCGLYATKRLRDTGLSVRAFDAADGVGGVWTWNRYPGARTDSLHDTYCFTFDRKLVDEWSYTELHPGQAEVLAYLNFVADKYDLRRHYTFGASVTSAVFDQASGRWRFRTDQGESLTAKYFVTGLGLVSAPILPDVPGLGRFSGEVHHTSRWPEYPVEFAGKRVAVIGTGSSGVQLVSTIANTVGELTVFQRTPNWVVPTGNRPVTEAEHEHIRAHHEEISRLVRNHPAGWPWELVNRKCVETPAEVRDAMFEAAWQEGGFALLYKTFSDLSTDKAANDIACAWMAKKIASIVDDPEVVDKLTPTHPYGAKRPPAADGYYQAFNEPHVRLVDIKETPIEAFTEKGIRTTEDEFEVDLIVLATGFDAITGAFTRMDIRGIGGRDLNEYWREGPRTYLGLGVSGFPNMFMVAGPQSPFANLPPGAQEQGNWIAGFIAYLRENGIEFAYPTEESEVDWTKHLHEVAMSLMTRYGLEANSWFAGANIEGKARAFNVYFGGHAAHADRCAAEAAAGYPSFRKFATKNELSQS
ncbi:NAD(P)/FAD-dependent oxidoreductase [Saccharomonospora sp. NPDC046836]|uniref:flavin-containing monooxygenase n=1 Tax=Saccharomonospora sp. NPDC046836 TaxID=3156921 RepID=UPI0033EC5A45